MAVPEEWVVGSLSVLALTTTSQTASLSTNVDAVRGATGRVAGVAKRPMMLVRNHQAEEKNEDTYGVALRVRR